MIHLAATRPKCLLLATGGTIAMKHDPVSLAPVPTVSGKELLETVPGLREVADFEVREVCNIPSDYMDPSRWIDLQRAVVEGLQRDDVQAVVISHGTDTLEETAWFLDLTVQSAKPVVLVGAQRNGSDPDFDGPRNLLNAAKVATSAAAGGKGVLIVLNDQINAAREATKTHTSDIDSFKSGPFGFLGSVDEDRVVFSREPLRRQHVRLSAHVLPRVDIVAMYAGADGSQVRTAVANGAQGIVVQALGLGNVNGELYQAIVAAIRGGVFVVISTRVPHGRVRPVYGFVGGGVSLKDAGALFADDLSPQKARILLMLALQTIRTPTEIQALFDQ